MTIPTSNQDPVDFPESDSSEAEPLLVDWIENDLERPCNWPTSRIWRNLGIVSFARLLTPLASSMIAPATSVVLKDLGGSDTIGTFIVSIYVLGYALGPLLLAPLSETVGRLPVYHVCDVLFVIFNMACAVAPSIEELLAFRLLAGLAGSCPVAIGSGSVADCVPKERRGRVMAIFTCGPLLGPVVGPIAGGFLGQSVGWRSVFWVITIVAGFNTVLSFIFQSETYEPVLLEQRAKRFRLMTGNPNIHHRYSTTESRQKVFSNAIKRPLALLLTSPAVTITSVYVGLVYGYTYILLTSFGPLFRTIYGFSENIVGLTYLGFGLGCLAGLLVIGSISDRLVKRFSGADTWKAEYRLLPLLPGSLLVPIGLLWYGWSAQARIHWIMPIIGTAWVGCGTIAVFMPASAYLIDAFTRYAASAAAANTIMRSLAGAFLPLVGPKLYQSLGQGWGNTLLAALALFFTPISVVALEYGEVLRQKYPGRLD